MSAKTLGKASLILSVAGVIVTVLVLVLVFGIAGIASVVAIVHCAYSVNGICFRNRYRMNSLSESCAGVRDGHFCYEK